MTLDLGDFWLLFHSWNDIAEFAVVGIDMPGQTSLHFYTLWPVHNTTSKLIYIAILSYASMVMPWLWPTINNSTLRHVLHYWVRNGILRKNWDSRFLAFDDLWLWIFEYRIQDTRKASTSNLAIFVSRCAHH